MADLVDASGWLLSLTGDWIVDLYFPAMILAFYVSGNPHQPDTVVSFVFEPGCVKTSHLG